MMVGRLLCVEMVLFQVTFVNFGEGICKLPKHIGYDSNFILGDQKVIATILAAVNLGGS